MWCVALVLAAAVACGPAGPSAVRAAGPAPAAAQAQSARATTPGGTGGVNAPETLDKPYLVLVSFDGFRHDYLDRYETPSFDRVADRGVAAEALVPPYPSLTFPAHYTIATGLHPERHGLVGNRFYDPARGAEYNYRERANVEDGTWYGGEPIWVTAETQGMVAAAMLMVGTEADVRGVRPTFWTRYADRGTHRERVDEVLDWLALPPGRRPHLVTLYFSSVDGAGHRTGPASPAVAEAVEQVDADLGRLLDGIDALPTAARSPWCWSPTTAWPRCVRGGRSICRPPPTCAASAPSSPDRAPTCSWPGARRGRGRCATTSTTASGTQA